MNRLLVYLRGSAELTVEGAAQQLCLNRLAREQILFWNLSQQSEVSMSLCVYRKDVDKAIRAIERSQCSASSASQKGVQKALAVMKKRPAFLIGMIVTVAALLILPEFIWTVRVEGNHRLQTERILHELDQLGLGFGAWGPDIDSGTMRDQLMIRLPELRWCAVNRNGGCVTVLIEEKPTAQTTQKPTVANVVAARAGVIQEVNVLNGFRECHVGDAVTEGQLLVSGIATWPMGTQAVCAEAEIYAFTQRQISAKTPSQAWSKQYFGEEMTCYTLIVGRKRIKLSGNSGILHGKCDKIIEQKRLVLPGDYGFPLILEIQRIRPYELVPMELDEQTAAARLADFAERTVKGEMIAGAILNTELSMEQQDGCWLLTSKHGCREMIARTVPMPIFGEVQTP